MSRFDSILLTLDGSKEAARAVGCAVWLADRFGATLHILYATAQPLAPGDALAQLSADVAQRPKTVLHQTADDPVQAALHEIAEHAAELVVLSARGSSSSAGLEPDRPLGRIATALIASSTVPVLLIPVHYREVLPWRSLLVAASGEPAADHALALAARIGAALQLPVSAVYVEEPCAATGLTVYADAPHHEYPRRAEEMITRALAGCPEEHCRQVRDVRVRRGEPATELLAELERTGSSALALGWHGAFGAARAPVLKQLIERAECPLLIVREAEQPRVQLKVGAAIGKQS